MTLSLASGRGKQEVAALSLYAHHWSPLSRTPAAKPTGRKWGLCRTMMQSNRWLELTGDDRRWRWLWRLVCLWAIFDVSRQVWYASGNAYRYRRVADDQTEYSTVRQSAGKSVNITALQRSVNTPSFLGKWMTTHLWHVISGADGAIVWRISAYQKR